MPRSAGTPGDVMPVAGENQHQHHGPDDQNAGGFKLGDVRLGCALRGRLIRRWAGGGHGSIVAPARTTRGQPPRLSGRAKLDRFLWITEIAERWTARQPGRLSPRGPCLLMGNAKLPAAVSTPPRSSSAQKILRFAVFEVDLAAGELRRNGVRVRLQEQPFQILVYLLERAGGVVTREELRQKLWPADTFVDFDHSLNTAINKLREALGDSASNPRYVETLARRGYRFLVPVQPEAANSPAETPGPEAPFHHELEVPLPRRSLTRGLFGLIQLMYLIFYLSALFRLGGIERVTSAFLPGWGSRAIFITALVTAGVGIPLRCYLISAVAFDHRGLGAKFQRIFPLILILDQLWAVAPFLLAEKIGFGVAFAATAALLYVPFSERTLLRLAYP